MWVLTFNSSHQNRVQVYSLNNTEIVYNVATVYYLHILHYLVTKIHRAVKIVNI